MTGGGLGRWRLAAFAGATAGLALSPFAAPPLETVPLLVLGLGCLLVRPQRPRRAALVGVWLGFVAAVGLAAGLQAGSARIAAIDRGAFSGSFGESLTVSGTVAAVPRRSDGQVRVQVQTDEGRLLVQSPEPVADLGIGTGVRASGVLGPPEDFYRQTLLRQGISTVLTAGGIDLTGARRGGLAGRLDAVRARAEDALGRGMPAREASLARGFVLGQDDRIDPQTVDDFQRSGLSHLLAVSGENVVLLALLAAPLLAALGLALRARLLWLLLLVAAYVPLAGGGPSIQRAGVMGGAAIVATLAGRPASRAYALLAAAAVTLALNPRASGDIGWQLSFAAVAGIYLLAGPIREAVLRRREPGPWARALAEGVAVTAAATLATAPLIALHFGTLQVGSLLANLLALPAVAPAMWLGMIAAGLGQVPGFPVEIVNSVNALLLGYVAQIAAWFGRPGWAEVEVGLSGAPALIGAYAGIALAVTVALRIALAWRLSRRRRRNRPQPVGTRVTRNRTRRAVRARPMLLGGLLVILVAGAGQSLAGGDPADLGRPGSGLRVEVLDVGQGDAILLQPPRAGPILVDGGPPGDGLAGQLRDAGVRELSAAVVTHDQLDHAGGIVELLGRFPVRRLVYAAAGRELLGAARGSGASPVRVAVGSEVRSGALSLQVLWPPQELLRATAPGDGRALAAINPNDRAIVLLARWGDFRMLLTGDAEAESVPMNPGPVEVLKVSHHGSEDAGLAALLDRTSPRLAVISVGSGNPFGHPVPQTLRTLASHRVRVLRTDRDGTVVIDVHDHGDRLDVRTTH